MKELKKKLTENLIRRVFNHSELIEEIITDFKESKEFKQLILSGVSHQREPLIAFHKWQQSMWTNPNDEITENVVDVYLKTN